jgi:hypothetical protein
LFETLSWAMAGTARPAAATMAAKVILFLISRIS